MSGSCYSCATQFGYFKKEHGCKNCGYSFCKDCVTKKIAVPKCRNEKHKVCDRCYDVLIGNVNPLQQTSKYSPPEALKKRLAALDKNENTAAKSRQIQQSSSAQKGHDKYKGMDKKDVEIAERLEKLKEDRLKKNGPIPSQKDIEDRLEGLKDKGPPPPGEKEMAERLAVLKGQDPSRTAKPFTYKPDKRSEQKQIDDLLDEIYDEVEIDNHGVDPAEDISSRLTHFKDQDGKCSNKPELGKEKQYTKTIGSVSAEEKSASGENIDIEDMNRLMKQVAQEMELDAERAIEGLEKDKELMARLNQLKKDRKKNKEVDDKTTAEDGTESNIFKAEENNSDSEDEEEAIKRILKQSLAEIKLDEDLSVAGYSDVKGEKPKKGKEKKKVKETKAAKPTDEELESDPDEFPWCCICNEDASIRCIGCDYDLYCKRCYKEGHDLLDMKDHKTVPFKQKGS